MLLSSLRPSAALSVLTFLAAMQAVRAVAAETLIDLTHPFNAETIYWPTEAGFRLEKGPSGLTERGYYYAANRFAAPEHGGTHIDSPVHFSESGETVDRIPLARLIGEGVVVDVAQQCSVNRDYLITVEDLRRWEAAQKASLAKKIVLLRTGFAEHWPDRAAYLGTTATGRVGVRQLHFPGLDPAAATWLATRRNIKAVGIDTASIDHGPSRDFKAHVNLFRYQVPALENVASMKNLPPTGFRVLALPMKIAGGSGAPCRVVAMVGQDLAD